MLSGIKVKEIKQGFINNSQEFHFKAAIAKCLGDPSCLKILYILSTEKYVCPSDFSEALGVSLPAISHQLARLKQMGVVEMIRHGQKICYFLADADGGILIRKIIKTLIRHEEFNL